MHDVNDTMHDQPATTIVNEETSPSPAIQLMSEELSTPASFRSLFRAVLRASVFLRFPPQDQSLPWAYLLVWVLVALVLQLAGDFMQVGSNGQVWIFGIAGVLFFIPVCLTIAIVDATVAAKVAANVASTAALSGYRRQQIAFLTLMFSALFLLHQFVYRVAIELYRVEVVRPYLPDWRPSFDLAMAIWLGLASGVAAVRILKMQHRLARFLLIILTGIALALPLIGMYRDASLWVPDYSQDDGDLSIAERNEMEQDGADDVRSNEASNQEALIYEQPKILGQQLGKIHAATRPQGQLFLVAVAGYASQDVFMNEVRFVEQLFQQRFAIAEHSISLINNKTTVIDTSIASVTALRAALMKIGEVMRPERDVLFLYLTSHGAKTHKFVLDFENIRFQQLNPLVLKKMLDDAGIKHRVIVVSTCYSGGYIAPLKDENSLIITSSAADKTSFGCSNDADYTFFGKAFFVDALREDRSFVDAFALAKPAISEREKKEDYEASNPQIFVGEKIQAVLDRVRKAPMGASSASSTVDKTLGALRELPFSDQADKQKRLRLAQDLIALFQVDEQLAASLRVCQEEQALNTAEKIYRDNPTYFGGITPSSPLWPRVVMAMQEYQRLACISIDNQQYTDIMVNGFARAHSALELEKLLKFYQSDLGKKSVHTNTNANLVANKLAYKISSENNARANDIFAKEIGRLIAEFNRKK